MKPLKVVDPKTVRTLLIFCAALESRKNPNDHLFRVNVAVAEFWVFSVSGYLQSLLSEGVPSIELEMPHEALRLRSLNRWFSTGVGVGTSHRSV